MFVPLQTAVGVLRENPELALALGVCLRAALAWQRGLSWYEYRTLHGIRRLAFPTLQQYAPVAPFVRRKGGRDDAEFLTTRRGTVRATVRQLREAGGTLHLISSIKRRPSDHGDPLSRAHLVWTHADGRQTEAYLFANSDGTTDVYAHVETSVTDPVGHLTETQTNGDARAVVRSAYPWVTRDYAR